MESPRLLGSGPTPILRETLMPSLTLSRALALALLLLPCRLWADAPDAVVTFNEVLYNPGSSQDGEWVELHNQMAVNVDLSRWSLSDGIGFTFPEGTIVPGGGFVVVAKNPADPSLSGVSGVLGPFTGNLSNSGETIDLVSPTGRLMDRIDYGDDGVWPVAADGLGATLAKKRPGTASAAPENWNASAKPGGTPGTENHPLADGPILHELISGDAVWRYHDSGAAPTANWLLAAYDDVTWTQGQGPFGSGIDTGTLTVTAPLAARYRAGAITGVPNASTFPTWPDSHTGDGSAQNATAGGNPTFQTAATPTGEPAVRFDGNDQFRTSLSPGIPGNTGFVYFIVCRANATQANGGLNDGSGAYLFDRDPSSADSPLVSLKAVNGKYGFQKRHDDSSGLGGPISTTSISTGDFQVVAVRRNPGASRFEIWVDGTLEASTPDNGVPLTPQPIVIGRHAADSDGGFNGDIAEILVYRSALSEEEFQSAGAYLGARYGLETEFPGGTVRTELNETATRYFRQTFSFSGNPDTSQLRLEHTLADGAVFYLNGEEIARSNLPAGPPAHDTAALEDVSPPASSGVLQLPADALRNGTNVLAVSLHSSAGDSSGFFSANLDVLEPPAGPDTQASLVLHEISGAGDADFFVEIHNSGSTSANLEGYGIAADGPTPAQFNSGPVEMAAGSRIAIHEAELGFRPLSGDKIGLLAPNGAILDARVVTNRLRGRSAAYPDRWIFPAAPTPGAANSFDLQHDIVINEICYHPPDLAAIPGVPPTIVTLPLLPYHSTWRYNASGANLGSSWANSNHPVGGAWQSGPGIHAYSPNSLPVPIGTPLPDPLTRDPGVITYYFETEFTLTASDAANLEALRWNHLIDDGAVFYLNGVEIYRHNMPAGAVTASTVATSGVGTAGVAGPINVNIPPGTAGAGSNRISVQVHQTSINSSDLVFGLELSGIITTDPGTPDVPVRESDEQWLELHNRGDVPIDLSRWNFSEGITFTFPQGSSLAAGGHLIVARDPARHSGITAYGPYSGSLARSGETLVLRDSFNNPADIVPYIDGGRWPGDADGDGAALELRNPHADNSIPESWAASDESERHLWESHSYQGVATASSVGPDGQWQDFVLGLLDGGEILIDDIHVIEDPEGAAIPLVQGGNFESGTSAWRFLGNHRDATIVPDPENPSNNVLHLRATGATEHMHNHVETTLANGRQIVNGRTYRISFRSRWLRGINLLNTRLYFNRLAKTTTLARPGPLGTPGLANSVAASNLGPGFTRFSHSPAVPLPGEPVTVTAKASDPDGMGGLILHHSVAGGPSSETMMTPSSDGSTFTATLPGQSAAAVVRFHISATDAAATPALSYFPAEGPDSHAFYQVDDGLADSNGLHNIRIIMDPDDREFLYQTNNLMSNGRIGCTVIYNEREIHYNVGVRLKSSQRGRPQPARVGFNLGFNKGDLFRGIHGTIAIDRSEGQITGCQEILYDHMLASSGFIPAEYNDLVKVIAPDPAHSSSAILQLARYGNDFLDSQFENGSDGTVHKYELVYYPTTADANGYKLPVPDSVVGTPIRDLGDDKERYRWVYLTESNEQADNYSGVMEMARHFSLSGAAFQQGIADIIDVDQWLGALAAACASGAGDSFFANSQHNGQFYQRPADGRMLYFPHDHDFSYDATRPIFQNNELQKLIDNPAYRRAYLGHLHYLCTTIFSQSGMAPWSSHFGALLPEQNFPGHLSYINTRSNFILNSINSDVARVEFRLTTNGGADFGSSDSPVILEGTGWVDVREIRLGGSSVPLDVEWTSANTWRVGVPVIAGANLIILEARNAGGELVGSDSVTITSSVTHTLPTSETLVVSELLYHPAGTELTEFVELLNRSPTATLDLSGVSFTDGITFTFPVGTFLNPGARILIVKDPAAFSAAYGEGLDTYGGYPDNLSNSGETVTLSRADGGVIQSFAYGDAPPWPTGADGDGWSLTLIDPFSNPDPADPRNWRAGGTMGGSPGTGDTVAYDDWKTANGGHADDEDRDGDGFNTLAEYFLGGDPRVPDRHLAPVHQVGSDGTLVVSVDISASAQGRVMPESSTDLESWQSPAGVTLIANTRLAGSPERDRLTYVLSPPAGGGRRFIRFAFHP